MIVKYMFITFNKALDPEGKEMQKALDNGWQPYGSPFLGSTGHAHQAVVLIELPIETARLPRT